MTDDSSLVELSKLLHTHDWPGDISLLIGSFLGETVLRVELFAQGPAPPRPPPPKRSTTNTGLGIWRPTPPVRPRGRRHYESTQPFYAGLRRCAWPPTFEVDASIVAECEADVSGRGPADVYVVITAIGPRGRSSTFMEEFLSLSWGPARGELVLEHTNWLLGRAGYRAEEARTLPPYVRVVTVTNDGRRAPPDDGPPPPLTGPARLEVTLHINDESHESHLPLITTCHAAELDRTDTICLLEGAISYRWCNLPRFFWRDWDREGRRRPVPPPLPAHFPRGPDNRPGPFRASDFPRFRVEFTYEDAESAQNVWVADAMSSVAVKEGFRNSQYAYLSLDNRSGGEANPHWSNQWLRTLVHDSSLRCRVHALRGNEICTLYDGKAGNWAERETDDFRGETRRLVHFAEHKFPFRVPPWFCVGAFDDYKGSLSSLSCRPFLNSVSDERSYFRLMICDPHDRDEEVNDPEELLSQLDHARWAPLRKEPWLGQVVHNDEIHELGAGAPGRETYHMDIAPDDGTIVDDYSYARGASVCRMRYPGDSDEEEEFFGDDDDD